MHVAFGPRRHIARHNHTAWYFSQSTAAASPLSTLLRGCFTIGKLVRRAQFTGTRFLSLRKATSGFWPVRRVKDMRVVNGKRMWLLAYAGVDEADKPWPDTWEPTRNLTADLKHNFFYDRSTVKIVF